MAGDPVSRGWLGVPAPVLRCHWCQRPFILAVRTEDEGLGYEYRPDCRHPGLKGGPMPIYVGEQASVLVLARHAPRWVPPVVTTNPERN